jgi:hypothetical protein
MIKKSITLIFVILLIVVLAMMSATFFYKNINESRLVTRHVNSLRAFWLAEAGVAAALSSFANVSGNIGDASHTYSADLSSIDGTYYRIYSTGTVNLGGTTNIKRVLEAIIKTGTNDPAKFQYGIETTTELTIKGSVDINPDNSKKEYSTLDFADLFGIAKTDMKTYANNLYTGLASFDMNNANKVTWIDVQPGAVLDITGGTGSGVLVINGNVKIRGNAIFDGIIYVIGELTMTGTPIISGSILAESSTTVDTYLGGNVTINYDIQKITDALTWVKFLTRNVVSWRECRQDCPAVCSPDCQAACLCQN